MNRKILPWLALAALTLAPVAGFAANTVDATLIPDGTYSVKVERVVDAKHILVVMDNGTETTLSAGRTHRRLFESAAQRYAQALVDQRQRHGLRRHDLSLIHANTRRNR